MRKYEQYNIYQENVFCQAKQAILHWFMDENIWTVEQLIRIDQAKNAVHAPHACLMHVHTNLVSISKFQ
jgi:hypothetical protein